MKLTGCSAVVTGGASGLGEATARALAAEGVKVAIFDLNAEKGEAVAASIGGIFCHVDVRQDASVDAGLAKARAAFGQERILVNCAGLGNAVKTASPRQTNRRDQTFSARSVRAHRADQSDRNVPLYREKLRPECCNLQAMEDGERGVIVSTASVAAEDGQIRAGRLRGLESRHRRHDVANRARSDERRHSREHDSARHLRHAADGDHERARAPGSRRGFGAISQTSRCAGGICIARLEICRNSYLNGASFRLDGAIRMAPR